MNVIEAVKIVNENMEQVLQSNSKNNIAGAKDGVRKIVLTLHAEQLQNSVMYNNLSPAEQIAFTGGIASGLILAGIAGIYAKTSN